MKFVFFLASIIGLLLAFSAPLPAQKLQRPKLVVGIVIDQMRWDFLYRYYDRYGSGGFKRMLNGGFSCENTLIPYTPTVTACGHTCLYTGSVPAIHGITGNAWWDRQKNEAVYCTEDDSVFTVGSMSIAGQQSPRNLLVTTICDELRIATNFRSKVIGIAFKDRGGILPAGHSANAAYWYDPSSGAWITSSYYMKQLPAWVSTFNSKKWVDKYYQQDWKTLHPLQTYVQSVSDTQWYEARPLGQDQVGFPYDLKRFTGKSYSAIGSTPYGSSLTLEFAKEAVIQEKLGVDMIPDFLAISFSSPDYVGHAFGPNSIEVEDTYLRLDRDLAELFSFLNARVGENQYLVFLSADHGVAHVPGFLTDNRIPAGTLQGEMGPSALNNLLRQKFGVPGIIASMYNSQVSFNYRIIDSAKLDINEIKRWVIDHLTQHPDVARVFESKELMTVPLPEKVRERIVNGFYPKRCGDIHFILKPHWIEGHSTGTTHGQWNPYDAHIPLLFYGWGVRAGKTYREVHMSDVAPTLAALLRIQTPSGSIGNVIHELMQ